MNATPLAGPQICHEVGENGKAYIHVDHVSFDYRIVLRPSHRAADVAAAYAAADRLGLEVMDPEECEADIEPDGTVTIWCVPAETV